MLKDFPKTIDIGIEHGTVLALAEEEQYEITTFRTESTYQDYRRPDHVEFVRSLEEDLKRRDFTINAFALKEHSRYIKARIDGPKTKEEKNRIKHPWYIIYLSFWNHDIENISE